MNTADSFGLSLMIGVAKKYYVEGKNQEQIAVEERISKSTVCRILKSAEESGCVSFWLKIPAVTLKDIAVAVATRFSLEQAFVTPTYVNNPEVIFRDACRGAAQDIYNEPRAKNGLLITCDDASKETSLVLSHEFEPCEKYGQVIAMEGIPPRIEDAAAFCETLYRFSSFFSANPCLINAPIVVDSKSMSETIRAIPSIALTLENAALADIALFEIKDIALIKDYTIQQIFSEKDLNKIEDKKPACEIGSVFYGQDGKPASPDLTLRTISLSTDALKKIPLKFGVAVGVGKVSAVLAAIKGKLINRLYTDEHTALALLAARFSNR